MSVRSIPELLLRLSEDVLWIYVQELISSFESISSRFGGVGAERPTVTRILPCAAAPSSLAPAVHYVSREHLASAVLRESLYITMYDLLLDALAAEYGVRLIATQSAEKWRKERTSKLRRLLLATRRKASTQEVIEIAGGTRARAVTSKA